MDNKYNIKKENFEYVQYRGNGEHVLQNANGELEVWVARKNHASYGLIYKNTHLEFARMFL